jgi:hypothetical protein
MLVISFTIEVGVIWLSQTGVFEWIEIVIGTRAASTANGLLITRFYSPLQDVLIVGAFEILSRTISLAINSKWDVSSLIEELLGATAARWLPSDMRRLTIELSVDSVRSSIVVLRLKVISVSFLICLWSEHTSACPSLSWKE